MKKVDNKPLPTVEDVKKWTGDATKGWIKKNIDEDAIREKVFKTLDKNAVNIILKLVGFKESWGDRSKFELDYSSNNLVSQAIRDKATAITLSWIETNFGEQADDKVKFPKLKQREIASLRAYYRREFIKRLKEKLSELVDVRANDMANSILDVVGVDLKEIRSWIEEQSS